MENIKINLTTICFNEVISKCVSSVPGVSSGQAGSNDLTLVPAQDSDNSVAVRRSKSEMSGSAAHWRVSFYIWESKELTETITSMQPVGWGRQLAR